MVQKHWSKLSCLVLFKIGTPVKLATLYVCGI